MQGNGNGRGNGASAAHCLARGLGWFSIGLGVAQILAPRAVARWVGAKSQPGLLRALGAREIVSGVGILAQQKPRGWVWARVGGDVMDLALLGSAISDRRANRRRLTAVAGAVAAVTAVDVLCGQKLSRKAGALHVRKSITINRAPEELYQFWRNFENLPRFMAHLESVQILDGKRSHWVVKGPAGSRVEWDAEIVEDQPNQLIAWRSLPGADVDNAGTVRFERATGGRGTVVTVELNYEPPGGLFGATVAKLLGQAPEKQVPVDLLRLRQIIETGVLAVTEGQPAGRARSTSRKFDDFVRA